jgi:hypothetical protein
MKRISLLLLPCVILMAFELSVCAQDTAFTYQGRLTQGDDPANGNYDFQFSLFSAPSGGTSLFAFSTNNVAVSNGVFTVTVDFGESAFPSASRWLEIAARPNGALGFVTVSPRQPVTSTPYAIRALSAGSVPSGAITSAMLADGAVTASKLAPGAVSYLGAPDGSPTNALVVNASGLVGIGTDDPQAGLDISATVPILSARRLFQVRDETASYTNLATARSLAAFGNLLAVLGGADDGVTVLSISNPQSPILRSHFRQGDGSFTNLHGALGLAMKTNLLAVAAFVDSAVTLVSLTNPSSPVRLAELRDGVSGWNELSGARAVAISGNLMAIAAQTDNAVTLADISNPLAPVRRAEMKDGVSGFANLGGPYSVAISGNLLAIGARLDRTVTLVDISDPANPLKRAELTDGVGGYDNLQAIAGVAFSGQLLAIAADADDAVTLVGVMDIANPVKLAEIKHGVGGIDSLDGATSVAFSGNWLAVASVGNDAVTLLDIVNPSSPRQLIVMRDDVGGFSYLDGATAVTFVGTNLAIAAHLDDGLTLSSLVPAGAGLVTRGRLGIGTDSPAAPLHVVGDVVVQSSQLFTINAERVELGIGTAANAYASTAMGYNTIASGIGSTAMGSYSRAGGSGSTALGYNAIASRDYSTALGRDAEAAHQGAFVWADSAVVTQLTSTNENSVTMRASGGYRLFSASNSSAGVYLAPSSTAWAAISDHEAKKNLQPIKGKEILEKLAAVPIQRWNYKWESDTDVPHIGPVAQDFKAAFYPGRDDKTITTLEFDGVALAAIQGLNQKIEEQRGQLNRKDADIQKLKRQNQRLEDRLLKLEASFLNLQGPAHHR